MFTEQELSGLSVTNVTGFGRCEWTYFPQEIYVESDILS